MTKNFNKEELAPELQEALDKIMWREFEEQVVPLANKMLQNTKNNNIDTGFEQSSSPIQNAVQQAVPEAQSWFDRQEKTPMFLWHYMNAKRMPGLEDNNDLPSSSTMGQSPFQQNVEAQNMLFQPQRPDLVNPMGDTTQQTSMDDFDEVPEEELMRKGANISGEYNAAQKRAMKMRKSKYAIDPSTSRYKVNVKKISFNDSLKNYLHNHSKTYRNYEGLTPTEAMQKWGSKFFTHFTGREYYGLASELHDDGKPSKKRLRDNDFYKLSDIHNEGTRRLIEKNMIQNLGLDPNDPATYEKIKDMDVVVPKFNSTLQKQLKNSENMADYVVANYENLRKNPGQWMYGSTTFKKPAFWRGVAHPVKSTDEGALFSVLNKADRSSRVNPDGSMDILINDLYDFDYIDPKDASNQGKVYANINNRAFNQQEAGQLQKYALAIPIHLTKEEVEAIFYKRANPSVYDRFLQERGWGLRN